jgi:GcrA cell cycle regulator
MQSTDWPPEHCEALRSYLAKGMSFSDAADAINTRFDTFYTRSAAIGRARRMGLARPGGSGTGQPEPALSNRPELLSAIEVSRRRQAGEQYVVHAMRPPPAFERAEPVKLRCVEIVPRHLSLADLERGDCRYPYGGDEEGDAITYCGHPRRAGSSYCAPHFHLTRGPGTASERAADATLLRLVERA